MRKPDHRWNCCPSKSTTETAAGATKFPHHKNPPPLETGAQTRTKTPRYKLLNITTKSIVANHRRRESNPDPQIDLKQKQKTRAQ
jgi:hypothetical protein